MGARWGTVPRVSVDRRLSFLWFAWTLRPDGWSLPAAWDPIAGDCATSDGWIRLHTNAPHHRDAALRVLRVPADKGDVERAVREWSADALEDAVVREGGCAATMRSVEEWKVHPQGQAVNAEPPLHIHPQPGANSLPDALTPRNTARWTPQSRERPLAGLRVLDLTRVLAGPVATRFLAAFGADVLRIDPLTWDEPGVVPEVTLGKRCARLDLREPKGQAHLRDLLRDSHVLVHGYRADALENLGFDVKTRRELRSDLIDVSLNAYGWTGPWRNRRGFDSLVQMSAGIADKGMRQLAKRRPTPLPVQALDHATGYLIAAAVVRGLTAYLQTGQGYEAHASLARTASLLINGPPGNPSATLIPASDEDYSERIEHTSFGPAHRLRPPVHVEQSPMHWDRPAVSLGSAPATW